MNRKTKWFLATVLSALVLFCAARWHYITHGKVVVSTVALLNPKEPIELRIVEFPRIADPVDFVFLTKPPFFICEVRGKMEPITTYRFSGNDSETFQTKDLGVRLERKPQDGEPAVALFRFGPDYLISCRFTSSIGPASWSENSDAYQW